MSLVVEALSVEYQNWGAFQGKYTGRVRFKNAHGSVEVILDPTLSAEVLKLCAESIARQAKETAKIIAGDIIDQVALPAPSDEVAL